MELKIEYRNTEDLIPFINNPRTHSEDQIAQIAGSIRFFGFSNPILVDNENGVIAGHGRLLAARKLKLEEVPVVELSSLTPLQRRALLIADNKIAENAGWDMELLSIELQTLKDENFEMNVLGFTDVELDELYRLIMDPNDGLTDEDAVPEPQPDAKTQLGDLWQLGTHRLLCGDATSEDDVSRLMAGERAALFATDPPYMVNYDGTNHPQSYDKKRKGKKDPNKDWSDNYVDQQKWDSDEKGQPFYEAFMRVAVEHAIRDGVAWYCWHASRWQAMLEATWGKFGVFQHQQIIWVKTRPVLTRSVMLWQHEVCLFGWRRGQKPEINRESFERWPTTVWDIPSTEVESDEHPTSKPVRIFTIPIELHTKRGEICYEPFAGSGSQYIAGEKTGRRIYGLELSPVFCDVVIRRWQEFTGKAAVKDDGTAFDDAPRS